MKAVLLLLLGAASVAPAQPPVEVPASVQPAPIHARGLSGSHSFEFSVDVSPCRGPGLTLDHVTVVERPANARGVKAAIVTAYLFHPAHIEGRPCHKVRRIRLVRVRTKRPASDLVFFDGSGASPRRIFPLTPRGSGVR